MLTPTCLNLSEVMSFLSAPAKFSTKSDSLLSSRTDHWLTRPSLEDVPTVIKPMSKLLTVQ